jgi:MFS family permease
VVGMVLVLTASVSQFEPATIAGAVVMGLGFGGTSIATVTMVLRDAPPSMRGGVTSAYLTIIYAAMGTAVLAVGLLADQIGIDPAPAVFTAVVVVMALVAAKLLYRLAPDEPPLAERG